MLISSIVVCALPVCSAAFDQFHSPDIRAIFHRPMLNSFGVFCFAGGIYVNSYNCSQASRNSLTPHNHWLAVIPVTAITMVSTVSCIQRNRLMNHKARAVTKDEMGQRVPFEPSVLSSAEV